MPPPQSRAELTGAQWSRPASLLIFGVRCGARSGGPRVLEGVEEVSDAVVMIVDQPRQSQEIVSVDEALIKREDDLPIFIEDEKFEVVALRRAAKVVVVLDLLLDEEGGVVLLADGIIRRKGTQNSPYVQHDTRIAIG